MNSIDPKCNKAKWAYDNCFNNWFREKYLVEGKQYPEGYVPCEELHTSYKKCVVGAIEDQQLDISETRQSVLDARKVDIAEAEKKREESNKKE